MQVAEILQAVSAQLSLLVPSNVSVRADRGQIVVVTPSGPEAFPVALNIELNLASGGSPHEVLKSVVRDLLNEVQDVITLSLGTPWPPQGEDKSEFATPRTEIVEGVLLMWYGDDSPVTPVGRVPLD